MIQEKISSEVIEIERQEQQQLAMNSKGGSNTKVVDETKLQEFIGKVLNEWGAAEGALITFVGDRIGLFKRWQEQVN